MIDSIILNFKRTTAVVGLGAILLMPAVASAGGIALGSTRVIYPADAKQVSLSVTNSDEHNRFLIQTWVEDEAGKKSEDFFVTPPLFVSKVKSENTLRIIYNGDKPPQDREKLYWLNSKAIPSANSDDLKDKNVLQIAVLARIKLFVRPEGLAEKSADAPSHLSFKRSGNNLSISNASAFYVTLVNMSIGGKILSSAMVPPKSEHQVALPDGTPSGVLNYQTINDFGANTPPVKVQIN